MTTSGLHMVQRKEGRSRRTGWGDFGGRGNTGNWRAWRGNCLVPYSLLPLHQEQAFETSQKYKEGKYIIEMSHMVKDNGWD